MISPEHPLDPTRPLNVNVFSDADSVSLNATDSSRQKSVSPLADSAADPASTSAAPDSDARASAAADLASSAAPAKAGRKKKGKQNSETSQKSETVRF